jgi:hypothetical protein
MQHACVLKGESLRQVHALLAFARQHQKVEIAHVT